jgi:hypothetical protein
LYRDPRVATAQSTAKGSSSIPRVRLLADGSAEIVTVRRGRLRRHRLDETGLAAVVETAERTRRWHVAKAVEIVGMAAFLGAFALNPLLGWDDDFRGLVLFVGGLILWWTGYGIKSSAASRSVRRFEEAEGWFELTSLWRLDAGKPPATWLTLPQLRAVEELANAHGNMAAVRLEPGEDAVEVVTKERRSVERHRVASSGEVMILDSADVGSRAQARPWNRYGGKKDDWALVNLNEPGGE